MSPHDDPPVLSDDGSFDFSVVGAPPWQPPPSRPVLPVVTFADYVRDRVREAWATYRTCEASRRCLKQHAVVRGTRP